MLDEITEKTYIMLIRQGTDLYVSITYDRAKVDKRLAIEGPDEFDVNIMELLGVYGRIGHQHRLFYAQGGGFADLCKTASASENDVRACYEALKKEFKEKTKPKQ